MTVPACTAEAATAGTGAPPAFEGKWDQINWDQVTDEVTRLQVRIAKATQAGRWNKVQALQRLLTRSYSGRLLAVKRVTENKGKRTAGVDGKIWSTPMSKLKAVQSLTHRGYQPLPLRRVYIPKSNGKERHAGHSFYVRQGNASAVASGVEPRCRDHGRPEFVRLPAETFDG